MGYNNTSLDLRQIDSKMRIAQRTSSPKVVSSLESEGLSPVLARLLAARGVTTRAHLSPSLAHLLHYHELKGAVEMASILADAVVCQKRLLVVADYDADGATSCAIMMRGLGAFGANVGYIIPDRIEHGYGLTPAIAEIACAQSPKPGYIVTVDNGIASHAGIERCNELGVPVLVTDHHLPAQAPPPALCVVNPNQHGCEFPSKNMAGCGVAFYVMWALQDELVDRGWDGFVAGFDVTQLLPIVALGTVADVVAMDLNNRILVNEGLCRIRAGQSFAGLEALAKVSARNPRKLSTSDFGFSLGPRINAAGRLASMNAGVECLITDDTQRAITLAEELHAINDKRREIEGDMIDEAVRQLVTELSVDRYTAVLHAAKWHQGVIGIVAGRIKEKVWRPTLVMAEGKNGELKGSGRSIPGFHLRDALDEVDRMCPGVLLKFGGHAMAAGVTLAPGGLEAFSEAFEKVAKRLLSPALLMQTLETDGPLSASEMSLQTVEELKKVVWGQGFPPPVFCDVFNVVSARPIGTNGDHLKLRLEKDGLQFDAVKFRHADGLPPARIQAAYQLDANTWRDNTNLQLLLEHYETA